MVAQLARGDVVDGAKPFGAIGVADDRDVRDADGHDHCGDEAAHGVMIAHQSSPEGGRDAAGWCGGGQRAGIHRIRDR